MPYSMTMLCVESVVDVRVGPVRVATAWGQQRFMKNKAFADTKAQTFLAISKALLHTDLSYGPGRGLATANKFLGLDN